MMNLLGYAGVKGSTVSIYHASNDACYRIVAGRFDCTEIASVLQGGNRALNALINHESECQLAARVFLL